MEDIKKLLSGFNNAKTPGPKEAKNDTENFENTVDVKKINKIKRLERSIISDDFSQKKVIDKTPIVLDNTNNDANQQKNSETYNQSSDTFSDNLSRDVGNNKEQKLLKHANFYHNFSEYDVNVLDVIPLYFKKEKFAQENGIDNNKYL